jgi:DNA-binding response OmpR family regulator
MKTKILYVEDEPFLGKIVKETLELKGFEVLLMSDGAKVMESFNTYTPDICVLDVMLPHIDGFTLGKQIRLLFPELPVIFLTAKSQTDDLVEGFASGGTDYIKKPFSIEELHARIMNQLQFRLLDIAKPPFVQKEFKLGSITFSPGLYELHIRDTTIKLSNREAQVLTIFCQNKNQVVSRQELLLKIWGDDSFFNSRTLDVYVRKLREYLSSENKIEIITLKGKGYHIRVEA